MTDTTAYDPPLSGVQIIDLSSGPMTAVGRLLCDLGAQVTQVTLRGVSADDGVGPQIDSVPIGTAIDRHGMATAVIDTSTHGGGSRWAQLLGGADILIESTHPGSHAEKALSVKEIRAQYPALVILSISDFGRDNSYRDWQATTPVFHALTSELSRSGIPGREPLVPPAELPYHVAAAQAAVMTISVFLDRLRTGEGDLIDFSILDGAMQALDPPFGTAGTASAGIPLNAQRRDWDAERKRYPIIPCQDGDIRICLLATRQWRGMLEWMGRPQEFADPKYDSLPHRLKSATLLPAISRFCADKTRAELEREGQRHGVPIAAVLNLAEALSTEQVKAREFFRDIELAPGLVAPVPAGIVAIDGTRASSLNTAVQVGRRLAHAPILASRKRRSGGLPLEGIRVLDLGVIVVGSDTGRLFGDLGADVIKIESSAYPDGLRADLTSITHGVAAAYRNKRSIGINLRSAEGKALTHRLVAMSDVVLTNFKPGVAETLAMDYASLQAVNPGIVVVDSSAFGPTGPWATRLGYGPLVRAAAGFTAQWVYPGEPASFCDTVTVYPDHVCARIGVLAALALLLRRERTGAGGSASVAQSEVMLSHLAAEIAADVLLHRGRERSDEPAYDAPWGLFPAAGEDAWIAVTVRNDDDWHALCDVTGRPDLAADAGLRTRSGRDRARHRIDEAVRQWSARHSPTEAMELLQAAGVPAGAVLAAADVPEWGYYIERRAFREELHPYATEPFVMENVQIHSDHIADPPLRQAPLLGEQTVEIATELLGLVDVEVQDLITRGVLESAPVPQGAMRVGGFREAK